MKKRQEKLSKIVELSRDQVKHPLQTEEQSDYMLPLFAFVLLKNS